jgi:uncharacterized protein YjbJ (UPF0337 family)
MCGVIDLSAHTFAFREQLVFPLRRRLECRAVRERTAAMVEIHERPVFFLLAFSSSANRKVVVMNWDQIEGNWKQVKGRAKQQWGKLTDDDLDRLAGRRDELIGKIQERYGYQRDQAEREVDTAIRGW